MGFLTSFFSSSSFRSIVGLVVVGGGLSILFFFQSGESVRV